MVQPLVSRQKLLFFDWRDIAAGGLWWRTPAGQPHGVELPDPPPQVEMYAQGSGAPYGIRLAAQPAQKTEPYREWLGWGSNRKDAKGAKEFFPCPSATASFRPCVL